MASIISNSGWNLLAFAFFIASNFISLPLVVAWIGLLEFGKAGLVLAFWAPLSLIGAVFGQTATRELVVCSRDGSSLFESLFSLSLLVSLAVCVAFFFLGLLLYSSVFASSGFASVPKSDLYLPFLLAGTAWFAQQQIFLLQAKVVAKQDFSLVAKVAVFSSVSGLFITLLPSYIFKTANGYLFGYAASFVLTFLIWMFAIFRPNGNHYAKYSFKMRSTELKKVFRFGGWQFVNQLFGALCNQVDKYLIGVMSTPAFLGLFTAVNRLQEAAYMALLKVTEVLFPYFGSIAHLGEEEKKQKFVVFSWFVMIFSLVVLSPAILLSDSIISLWLGIDAVNEGGFLLKVLILSGIVGCGSNVFTYYMMGTGDNAPIAYISMVYSLVTIILSAFLFMKFGARAAGVGMVFSSLLRIFLVYPVLRYRVFKSLTFSNYFFSTLYPILIAIGITFLILFSLGITMDSWFKLFFAYAFFSFLYLLVLILSGFAFALGRESIQSAMHFISQASQNFFKVRY